MESSAVKKKVLQRPLLLLPPLGTCCTYTYTKKIKKLIKTLKKERERKKYMSSMYERRVRKETQSELAPTLLQKDRPQGG